MPIFLACYFFFFSFLHTSGMRPFFFVCGKTFSRFLPLFPVWPTGACYVRQHEIGSFNRSVSRGRFRSRVALLSLFLSQTVQLPSTLTSFSHSASVGRLLLPFSRSAGQPSLVSLEIFCLMNSCGSSGKFGLSIHCFDRWPLIRRKHSTLIMQKCLTDCLFNKF